MPIMIAGAVWNEGLPPSTGWYDVLDPHDGSVSTWYLQRVKLAARNHEPERDFAVWGWTETDDPEVLPDDHLWRGPVARPADADEW